jgi:hypothetical protein
VPLALAGGGAMLAEYGVRTGDICAWEAAVSLNSAATGLENWLWNAEVSDNATSLLQGLADEATQIVDAKGAAAYTPKQLNAIAANPNLQPAFRGAAIDAEFKRLIVSDPGLTHLQTAERFQFMPDVVDPLTGRWWDLTTSEQWQRHLDRYRPVYGADGILIAHP